MICSSMNPERHGQFLCLQAFITLTQSSLIQYVEQDQRKTWNMIHSQRIVFLSIWSEFRKEN